MNDIVLSWYIDDLKRFEGFVGYPYKPKGEKKRAAYTIGYGHTIHVSDPEYRTLMDSTPLSPISEELATTLLLRDVDRVVFELRQVLSGARWCSISGDRRIALIDFVFNLGISNFAKSSLFKLVMVDPDSDYIVGEFGRWIYSGANKLPGLIRRRRYESDLWTRNKNLGFSIISRYNSYE